MATFQKRGDRWRAIIRRQGHRNTSKSFRNLAQAKRWALQTESRMERLDWSDPALLRELTVGDLIDRYVTDLPGSMNDTKQRSLDYFKDRLGQLPIAELTSRHIIQYARKRLEKVQPSTVSVEVNYFHQVLKAASISWSLPVSDMPVIQAKAHMQSHGMVAPSRKRDRRPTAAELLQLREYWSNNPDQPDELPMAAIMDFAVASCMRRGEIVQLRWADLNETDRTIIIRNRKDPRRKVGNDQTVPLLGDAWTLVQAQDRSGELIWPYRPETISVRWSRACKALKIADLRWHDLRHEGISRLFEAGYSVPQVALVSGHKDWRHLARYTQIRAVDLHRD